MALLSRLIFCYVSMILVDILSTTCMRVSRRIPGTGLCAVAVSVIRSLSMLALPWREHWGNLAKVKIWYKDGSNLRRVRCLVHGW